MPRALLALLVVVSAMNASAAPPVKVASVEGVSEYRFDNGARLLLFPEPSRPTVTVNMTVLVGSRHEGYGEAGMAHLLEHLVFKGTPTFPEVPKALRDHGASFNGTTNVDRTNYFETLPATDENLEFAIHLECDRLVNSHVKREDLLSEFTVVRNEFERGENSPERVLAQRVQAAAYEWHNYGKSTIGNRSDIERVPIDNLRAFYERFYQPDNVVLIVTGKFEEARALELATKYLGSIRKPDRRLPSTYTEEPPQDGERRVTLRRVGKVGAVMAAYHMPASAHPDHAPLSLLASILSEDKIGRLEKNLVETGIATSASASADDAHDPGLFSFMAQPTEGKLAETEAALLAVADTLGDTPFTQEELDRAKVRFKRSIDATLASASAMAQALSSATAEGDWRLFYLERDRIAAATIDDVNRVAKTYFPTHNRTVGVFVPADAPQRLPVPAVASIADVVKDYRGGEAVAAGEAFDPSPENIDARTKVVEIDGVKLALLPKSNRGETVTFTLALHYGNERSLTGLATAAGMLPSMLMAGTGRYDRQQLRQKFDELGVRMGGGRRGGRGGAGGAGVLSFSMEAKRDTLPEAIGLLGEVLRDPSFPQDEFDQQKAQALAGLAQMQTEPQMLAGVALGRSLSEYPRGDVRHARSVEESVADLEAATLDQVKAVWKEQVSGAVAEVAIVGDFDPDAAVVEVKKALAGWRVATPYERVERTVKRDAAGAREQIVTPDKANAVFMAGLSFPLDDDSPDEVALEIGNFILGGGALSSRLGDRIRQKEGLSYGVTSSISVPARGDDARFTINAITNPANIAAVETAAMEELRRFLQSGPSAEELAAAKTAWLEARKTARSSDGAIAGQLASNLDLGRTMERVAEEERRVEALEPRDVQDAFRRHIDPERLVIIHAGDFRE